MTREVKGECDRCGFQSPLAELRMQPVNFKRTQIYVCPKCMDVDRKVAAKTYVDKERVANARPPKSQNWVMRELYAVPMTAAPALTLRVTATLTVV